MHTLIIPSYYPNSYTPTDGIYFKVQAQALHEYGLKVGVIAPIIIKHYVLKREKKFDYGFKDYSSDFPVYVQQVPSFPVFKWLNDEMRLYYGKKLFQKYVDHYGLPEIIHVHSFENGIVARWIKKKYDIPYIITEHSTRFERNEYSPRLLKLAQLAFNECQKCLVVSPELKDTLLKLFRVHAQIIPNLIDTNNFVPDNQQKKYDFISIGGLRAPKNYPRLIKCFYALQRETKSKLLIVGEGPDKPDLIKLIKEYHLEEYISLVGSKSQTEIIQLLNQSKIFVSSSTFETFGVAIIEAMSCGLPVVATKSGGPDYYLTQDFLGQLCEQSDESLLLGMRNVLNDYSKFDKIKIRQYVVDRFSSRVVATQINNIYQAVIKSF